jgi:arsenate reductase (thioredoxin)
MHILILCTGNSCRSQMAHGILQALDASLEVHSAGTRPADRVHPLAIEVMQALGLDISHHQPRSVDAYLAMEWDYVITVCGGAHADCPVFTGKVKNRIHIGFEDPAEAQGSDADVREVFRSVRDEILRDFFTFYQVYIRKQME